MHGLCDRLIIPTGLERHSRSTDLLSMAHPKLPHGRQPCFCHVSALRRDQMDRRQRNRPSKGGPNRSDCGTARLLVERLGVRACRCPASGRIEQAQLFLASLHCEQCTLWQQNSPATPKNSAALERRFLNERWRIKPPLKGEHVSAQGFNSGDYAF